MLEQAIIDAEALKEAAVKTAEQTLLEKYSTEIKNAVSSLLEQDEEDPFAEEDPLAGGEDFGMGEEGEAEEREDVVDQLDMVATQGEKLCPCPDDGEEVVLDLDQLVAAAEEEEPEDEMGDVPETEEELFEIDDDYLLAEAEKADKDYDGDGEVESEEAEWKGSRTKAIKKAQDDEERPLESPLAEEGTKGYRKGDPTWGKPDKEDEDDPIDFEKKTKSGKREKIGGKILKIRKAKKPTIMVKTKVKMKLSFTT